VEPRPAPVDREVGEALRRGARPPAGSARHQQQVPGAERERAAVHQHLTPPADAHDEDVQLGVHVLPHAPAGVEGDQVGVEVAVARERPGDALSRRGLGQRGKRDGDVSRPAQSSAPRR
jgi:hypothetical protein